MNTKNAVNDRLIEFIAYKEISKSKFAQSINCSKQQLDSWINAKVKIPIMSLADILTVYPELNARWFIAGTGFMTDTIIYDGELKDIKEKNNSLMKEISELSKESEEKQIKIDSLIEQLLDVKNELIVELKRNISKGN